MYLVFLTKPQAEAAQAQISANMGLPRHDANGYVADRWAVPVELMDGRWAILKPAENMMALVLAYEEMVAPDFKQVAI